MTPPQFLAELRACLALLNQGRAADARPRIERLIAAQPDAPDPQALLGLALDQLGDPAAGAGALRRAIALKPAQAQYRFELGRVLARAGEPAEAAAAYRAHLQLAPAHGAARHNLGVALLEAGEAAAAEAELRLALGSGHDAPQTHLVLGRALEAQGRHVEAEDAYRAAIARRPHDGEAHRDLAQLVWRRTEDASAASAALDVALAAAAAPSELVVQKAKLLEFAGEPEKAFATLETWLGRRPEDALLLAAAAQAALAIDPTQALIRARRARILASADPAILATLCQAQLAAGEAAAAVETARALRALAPDDQQAIALLGAALRLAGDDAYRELFDPSLVRTYRLAPPPPWPDLASFLADLERALDARHGLAGHPIGQSTRRGGEAALDPRHPGDPVIQAFFEAVREPIGRHVAEIGPGEGPFRARRSGDFKFAGAWSVRLRPGGFHANHVHPRGWISSAFYVALPDVMTRGDDRAGWLKFGEPGPPTRPAMAPEHFVRPEPGLLALFPSYMWHGTVPFGGEAPRLTIAFDVVPA